MARTVDQLLTQTRRTVIIIYICTVIHHVIEGLGWVFNFRMKSLITPITFGIPLFITLGLLYFYKETRQKFFLIASFLVAAMWWIWGIGLKDGFYNHTLNVVLWLCQAPLSLIQNVYPKYVGHPVSMAAIPCDAAKFCTPTPAVLAYELAGIASFIAACVLAFLTCRLIWVGSREKRDSKMPLLSRFTVAVVGVGLLAGIGVTPTLSRYMGKGKMQNLIMAVVSMSIFLGTIIFAFKQLEKAKTKSSHSANIAE